MILAAGLGTRMRPLTEFRAKPALPVQGRPVISLLLSVLAQHGIRDVLINLHHRPDSIRSAVERDHPPGLAIHWSEEEQPLGTGGGIRRAAEFLRAAPHCLVLAGDMLLDLDLTALADRHRRSGRDVTLVLREDPRGADFGTIGVDERGSLTRIGRRILRDDAHGKEREGLFTSVRFFAREALEGWPSEEAFEDLRDWLAPRVRSNKTRVGAEFVGPQDSVWEPVGTPCEYLAANLAPPELPSLGGAVERWRGALRPPASAAPGTASSVIARNAEVALDARLEECVVWDRSRVPAGFVGHRGVFAGDTFHPLGATAADCGARSARPGATS